MVIPKILKQKYLFVLLILLLILVLLYSLFLFTRDTSKKTNSNTERAISDSSTAIEEIHFTEDELKQYYSVYENPFVLHIRKALDSYLIGKKEGMNEIVIKTYKAEDGTVGGLDAFTKDYYKSKFIVFAINNGVAGGKIINIIFQDKRDKLFNAWVYQVADGSYELRGFWQNMTFTKQEMDKIQKQYKVYLEDKQHAL